MNVTHYRSSYFALCTVQVTYIFEIFNFNITSLLFRKICLRDNLYYNYYYYLSKTFYFGFLNSYIYKLYNSFMFMVKIKNNYTGKVHFKCTKTCSYTSAKWGQNCLFFFPLTDLLQYYFQYPSNFRDVANKRLPPNFTSLMKMGFITGSNCMRKLRHKAAT